MAGKGIHCLQASWIMYLVSGKHPWGGGDELWKFPCGLPGHLQSQNIFLAAVYHCGGVLDATGKVN